MSTAADYQAGRDLTTDKHTRALARLAAVDQYLYDTMGGDWKSDRPMPLPGLAMEHVRRAQHEIHLAIRAACRTRRLDGPSIKLTEAPDDLSGGDDA